MANEFVARKGLTVSGNTVLSGSLTVSGSATIANSLTATSISGSFSGSGANIYGVNAATLTNVPVGVVSSSTQVKTLLPAGTVSSSVQIDHDATTNFVGNEHIDHTTVSISAGSGLNGGGTIAATRTLTLDTSSAHFTGGIKLKLNTDGVVSSSAQVSYTGLSNIPSGIVSSSTQVKTLLPAGTVSSSVQINTGSFSGSITSASFASVSPANTLTGTTLASNVVNSSLTRVGTLIGLTVSSSIQFSGSSANTIRLQVEESNSIAFYGNSGSLFGITDILSGSLMSVNDISGLPILEVFSDDRIVMGTFNKNTLVVTGSRIGIDKANPTTDLDISGSVFITGSLQISSGGITGSLFGTSSWATDIVSVESDQIILAIQMFS
jgi:hypothetical protein